MCWPMGFAPQVRSICTSGQIVGICCTTSFIVSRNVEGLIQLNRQCYLCGRLLCLWVDFSGALSLSQLADLLTEIWNRQSHWYAWLWACPQLVLVEQSLVLSKTMVQIWNEPLPHGRLICRDSAWCRWVHAVVVCISMDKGGLWSTGRSPTV